jgi:hypothetical protein
MSSAANADNSSATSGFAGRLQRIVQHGVAGQPCDVCGRDISPASVKISQRTPVIFLVEVNCASCGHQTAEWVIRNEAVDTVIDAIELHRTAAPVNENYEPEFLTARNDELTAPLNERIPVAIDELDDYPNPLEDTRLGSESAISMLRFKILWERLARLAELWS